MSTPRYSVSLRGKSREEAMVAIGALVDRYHADFVVSVAVGMLTMNGGDPDETLADCQEQLRNELASRRAETLQQILEAFDEGLGPERHA